MTVLVRIHARLKPTEVQLSYSALEQPLNLSCDIAAAWLIGHISLDIAVVTNINEGTREKYEAVKSVFHVLLIVHYRTTSRLITWVRLHQRWLTLPPVKNDIIF